ncbi:hypothetical protein BFG60_4092 [Microcystis aeruginosa NIES-98]|nr:hypothetical protein BFG60_4092 [Microcystis aeruginosa NIES-98]
MATSKPVKPHTPHPTKNFLPQTLTIDYVSAATSAQTNLRFLDHSSLQTLAKKVTHSQPPSFAQMSDFLIYAKALHGEL